ncbi:MAG TPA: hypothetical protein VMI13_10100 [Solirubrobacteraceae bacterium]|nr:hypothetical protein [Solirubrobacteraceae bacterium]
MGALVTGTGPGMHGLPGGEQWRCAHCAELLGAYEPIVGVEHGQARRTSRAAELRAGRSPAGEAYHEGCYPLRHDRP